MSSTNDFGLLKTKTCILKVNINCHGCIHKVKKLLRRVEGVYKVRVDAEEQMVAVSGIVEPSTLINKLLKSGKHAEIWSPQPNPNQAQEQARWAYTSEEPAQWADDELQPIMEGDNIDIGPEASLDNGGLDLAVNKHHHPSFPMMTLMPGYPYHHHPLPMMMMNNNSMQQQQHNMYGMDDMMRMRMMHGHLQMGHPQIAMGHTPAMFSPRSDCYYDFGN